jgi:hypothetical protein
MRIVLEIVICNYNRIFAPEFAIKEYEHNPVVVNDEG